MSAYNRKAWMKRQSSLQGSFDSEMDEESGYLSFRGMHNSTIKETPFLKDEESENCPNVCNQSWTSTQFDMSPLAPDETACKSPESHQMHQATKRRKTPFQATHTSPKKSKKKLFPQSAETQIRRTRYFHGLEHLDIISMLSHTLPALDCILSQVDPATLHAMTRVSKNWQQALFKIPAAVERLQNHRFKMSLTKENTSLIKKGTLLSRKHTQVPLQISNFHNSQEFKAGTEYDSAHSLDKAESNCLQVEQAERIKCPRCGVASKVYLGEVSGGRLARTGGSHFLSRTLPFSSNTEFAPPTSSLTSFRSMDLEEANYTRPSSSNSYKFAECTRLTCKFRFCTNCYCPPHPGERCLVTELGTPSKVMMPTEKFTPPKQHSQKYNSKLSRKNSLKRLCF